MSGGSACGGARGTGAECRKFAPNIFNKSKCSSCFKQKEEHSAEALECNRATRKISKCGYLFVAPGWDFSNPLNRTKRWQRRWFVLYDDGELTYSVDEHPETVPQARIDMTRVLEVAAAEDITGHPYSLAVTSPEGVTFVKGTCREETRWWADVLQVYSRNKGRHKRNATFPGGQSTILQVTPTIRSNTPNPPRPRFNSTSWIQESSGADLITSSFSSIPGSISVNSTQALVKNSTNSLLSNTLNGGADSSCDGSSLRTNVSPLRNSTLENGNIHSYVSSSTNSINGNSPVMANTTVSVNTLTTIASTTSTNVSPLITGPEKPPIGPSESRNYKDQPASSASPPTRDKLRAEDKARRRMHQQNERCSSTSINFNEKLDDDACRRILLEQEREREGKLRDIAASLTQPRVRRSKQRTSEPTRDVVDAVNNQDKLIRGDPDGCGLDISGTRYSPTSELRVDLPAEDLLNIKKGWLLKQGLNKEWNKHWFVLRGCGLMYYRDPSAEDKGIMDGVIDLNTVTAVTSVQGVRNYGFQTVTWDDRGTTILSAITGGIRSSWMSAIRRAANLPDPESNVESHVCQDNQQDINPQSPTTSITERERDSIVPSTPLTPRSVLFSSDEEYRTASEGGRRESGDWSEMPVSPPLTRNGEWSLALKGSNWSDSTKHEWSELPPSPPLTRTALSRVKARSRSSSRSRVYKRSRSSPPSSRRSTLDSVRSEDLMMACCELGEDEEQTNGLIQSNNCLPNNNDNNPLIVELLENQVTMLRDQLDKNQSHPNTLLVIIERQENEIEDLKSQLNQARTEIVNTEKELSRLRQQKIEANIREKEIEELLNKIQRMEKMRNKDLEDLEKMKKLYNRDKEVLECKLLESEVILRETTERCELITNELSSSHRTVERLQTEITALSDRLSQGIEENERLYTRVRELEGKNSLSSVTRERGKSFDSLSDLTNIDLDLDLNSFDKERVMEEYDELRGRFEKAILEIRAMRKELREAHAAQDALELEVFAYKQESGRANDTNQAQMQLMAARIQDLTNKLAGSDKQVRTLKQKMTKAETRDKRRSLSLKGRESFQISQEVEDKLVDLENKIHAIERGKKETNSNINLKKEKRREHRSLDRARLRRKSLDSATNSEPMKVLIRLSTLETKVAENLASDAEKDSSECSEISVASSTSEVSLEVLSRLKKLERAVAKSKRRLEKCLGSTQAEEKAEKCLRAVNDILDSCVECKKNQVNSQITESVGVIVSRLEIILRDKMCELMKKRQILAQNGQLNDKEKMKLIAERIAFECVILRQIKCAMSRTTDKSIVLGELVETSQLISNLKSKIYGTKPKTYQNTSFIDYLTRILANKFLLINGTKSDSCTSNEVTAAQAESLNFLLQKQKEINEIMQRFKDAKLKNLAEALATETLSLSEQEELNNSQINQEDRREKKLVEDRRIREAWALAQETVSKELVQAEISHFIMRCGQLYEQNITSFTDTCFIFDTNINLETWADKAQAKLREEMEYSIEELTAIYEDCLRRMKMNKTKYNMKNESKELLTDYADVVAQKALIDARIFLQQENKRQKITFTGKTFVSSLIQQEDILMNIFDVDKMENNPLHDAEYIYLYQQFTKECEEKISMNNNNNHRSKEQLKNVTHSLICMEEDIMGLKMCLSEIEWPKSNLTITDWNSICHKCTELKEQIKCISDYIKSVTCKQCELLQNRIQIINADHTHELEELQKNQERDLMDIKGEWDNQRHSMTSQYELEAASLRERARLLENRLNEMDSEHSAHVNELRSAYQRSMTTDLDADAETRKRYKEEIKQLRALCEKGLLAMENSHRRTLAEMEEKHKQELESLRIEKEQALSEETQATLAALDAMRKAHEHEVQKEIAKFKQEFIKQVQAREDIGILHKEHEVEMEEIKQEILSLSSKYSSKCVESAALEEKVGTLTKQLNQAQQHIKQLDARNKQLRAHLVLETNDTSFNETLQLLRGREKEITEQREEIHRLQQQLKVAQQRCESTTLASSGRRTSKMKSSNNNNNNNRRHTPSIPTLVTHPASTRNPQLSPLQS
ncbi:protein outspread isoform X2 [Leptopilina boulardi]|uniref:protein outspread isoform X2 n=1 Tax=Leptopilina boulardi TaxID=63433 RepID=UPI0021F5E653|nr:protein outspread isoform X2 [Leptopilina boulardi]